MEATFGLDDPAELSATLTVTTTIATWRKIEADLKKVQLFNSAEKLRRCIGDVVEAAEKTYDSEHIIDCYR